MAEFPVDRPWRLIMPGDEFERLHAHLFPGDGDEHGAVLLAGISVADNEVRLLVRNVCLAQEGIDYVPGDRGYRKLKAEFVLDRISECADDRLVYLAAHNHGGRDSVAFSATDLASHERGYPALLDIVEGLPVGGLVFAENAVAGDVWLPDRRRVALTNLHVIGPVRRTLYPKLPRLTRADARYDRQARMFGDRGQQILGHAKVAIIGLGGVGSLVAEYLGKLGVGKIVLVDPDRIDATNLPRVVGATHRDALSFLPSWLAKFTRALRRKKVSIAARVIAQANPKALVEPHFADVVYDGVAQSLRDCDYLFLAADSHRARLVFNALVHQYLIPGVQLGTKVPVDQITGEVGDVFTVVRPVDLERGCLLCNGLIDPTKLQEEAQSDAERVAQRYIDDPDVVAPSVITLNATVASYAVNDFLFYLTGLAFDRVQRGYMTLFAREREITFAEPRKSANCVMCGRSKSSVFARGDGKQLPTQRQQTN